MSGRKRVSGSRLGLIRLARPSDASELAALIHAAYREDAAGGWTTEADLIHGERISSSEIVDLIHESQSWVFLLEDKKIEACVHLKQESDEEFYFGMLAVRPHRQGEGLGRRLLKELEAFCRQRGGKGLRLTVISLRDELISYYQKLGFEKTGRFQEFPFPALAKVPGVVLMEMRKAL